jgi:hypothetical protein
MIIPVHADIYWWNIKLPKASIANRVVWINNMAIFKGRHCSSDSAYQ